MLACTSSSILLGVEGRPVRVEVHVSNGLPGFTVVGLPDASCREARDRVRAALLSSGLEWPLRRVTVNLAPSGLRKAGSGLDLAIAVALLAACGALAPAAIAGHGFLGELGLDGSLRPVPGLLPMVDAIVEPRVVVPPAGTAQALVLGRHEVRTARNLAELVAAFTGRSPWPTVAPLPARAGPALDAGPDLADVRGQPWARYAVEVAAAGGHHILMVGPPGAGKTMLANRLVGLLPDLGPEDALAATRVHSAAGEPLPPTGLLVQPPFRAPHHSASMAALIGGGSSWVRPGEASLAHSGVLFLDELAEFPPSVLDALRQPLEDGRLTVSRARATLSFPARFLLVAATNPCPCGHGGSVTACRCSDQARLRYGRRLSGPLLDRFDIRVHVTRPRTDQLVDATPGEASAQVAARVSVARALSRARGVGSNAQLSGPALEEVAPLSRPARALLTQALAQGRLSARGFERARRVARTVADLQGATERALSAEHVAVALQLRIDVGPLLGQVAA